MKTRPPSPQMMPSGDSAGAARSGKGGGVSPKGCFLLSVGFLALVAGAVVLGLGANDQQVRPPRLTSAVWTARAGGGGDTPRLYYVTEEERSQRRRKGRVYSYTVSYSIFALRSRDARTGAVTGGRELARIDNAGDGPDVIGPQGNVLWLWNDGPVAVGLDTLEPVWSIDKLRQLNPELGAYLPVDRKYYRVLPAPIDALAYKGADARYYQVDGATGAIRVLESAALAAAESHGRADVAFSHLPTPGEPMRVVPFGVGWDSLTDGDRWYALLTDEERAKLSASPGRGRAASGEESRRLYRGRFTREDRPALGTKAVLLDLDSVAPVNDDRYLMGGFLRRENTTGLWEPEAAALWRPEGGTDVLVLHKQRLGANSPWHLTRLRLRDGAAAWTCPIGLAELRYVCDAGGTVVFTGFADASEPTGERPETFVMIDEKTGAARTATFQE